MEGSKMSKALAKSESSIVSSLGERIQSVVAEGDLSKLNAAERMKYYGLLCESLGLNPMTKPFEYIKFRDGKLQLYATKDCSQQLRRVHKVSVTDIERSYDEASGDYEVVCKVRDGEGRCDCDLGVVNMKANKAMSSGDRKMTAVTKAKRRATLSLCGLGFLDESEVVDIEGATLVPAEVIHQTTRIDSELPVPNTPQIEIPTPTPGPRELPIPEEIGHVGAKKLWAKCFEAFNVARKEDLPDDSEEVKANDARRQEAFDTMSSMLKNAGVDKVKDLSVEDARKIEAALAEWTPF